MSRYLICTACQMEKAGVKSRIAFTHTCEKGEGNFRNIAVIGQGNSPVKRYSTGYTIITGFVRRWTKEQIEANDEIENRIVYENFTASDEGRSRKRICVCDDKETASMIVLKLNEYERFLLEKK